MTLDFAAAQAAMQQLADALGTNVVAAAEACLTVATSNMVASVLPYLARYGLDPADVTLVVYGGAGSLHGPLLAAELGIGRVLVPGMPSVFCAFGGLVAGLTHDNVKSMQGVVVDSDITREEFASLEASAQQWLANQKVGAGLRETIIEHRAEARYRGQSFQLTVNVPAEAARTGDIATIEQEFHRQHERLYAHADPSAAVEFTEFRVRVRGMLPTPTPAAVPSRQDQAADALVGQRDLQIAGRSEPTCKVYARERLCAGDSLKGTAIIEQNDTTILVPPGYLATVDSHGNILLTKES
jgi:N-methylhydantoinase A